MNHDRGTQTARYYNSNGFAVAIVAVVNYHDGELFDGSAYIGGTDRCWVAQDAIDWVTEKGDKIKAGDAFHFFPHPVPHFVLSY